MKRSLKQYYNTTILQIDRTDTVVQAKFKIFNEITKLMYRVNLKVFMTIMLKFQRRQKLRYIQNTVSAKHSSTVHLLTGLCHEGNNEDNRSTDCGTMLSQQTKTQTGLKNKCMGNGSFAV